MTFTRIRPRIAVAAAALAGLAFAASTSAAGAESAGKQGSQRLVVRGDATVVDNPTCEGGVCELQLVGGKFRGTPVGTGACEGAMKLKLTEAFENGEGGGCAPIRGQIVLGAGSPDRLVLAVAGDSCQDGAGPLTASSFTGLAGFVVKHGTGTYSGASGAGLATFLEDAEDHDRMTLIGRISR
jgi:hypothetical protein